MAKKYTSINFNHIYDKTASTNNNTTSSTNTNAPKNSSSSSFSSPSYSAVSAPNKHGRILVLTRPTPKPVTPPSHSPSPSLLQPQKHPNQIQQVPDQPRSEPGSDVISLRPLGRTGTGTGSLIPTHVVNHDKDLPLISPKPDKFVPPHLRPGFVAREEGPGPGVLRSRDSGQMRQGHVGSSGRFGEDGRPKSGGFERVRGGGGSDMGILGRPRSFGNRPSSSG